MWQVLALVLLFLLFGWVVALLLRANSPSPTPDEHEDFERRDG